MSEPARRNLPIRAGIKTSKALDANQDPGSCELRQAREENAMLDVIFIAATVLFFAAGILYVRACERLR